MRNTNQAQSRNNQEKDPISPHTVPPLLLGSHPTHSSASTTKTAKATTKLTVPHNPLSLPLFSVFSSTDFLTAAKRACVVPLSLGMLSESQSWISSSSPSLFSFITLQHGSPQQKHTARNKQHA